MQKYAGKFVTASLVQVTSAECVVVHGHLGEDKREVDANNLPRNFSNSHVRTSWVVELEYNEEADISIIRTRNSIYEVDGNIIDRQLESSRKRIAGRKDIFEIMSTLEKYDAVIA